MPYDAAGNFTRAFNWTADKLAGIKIESERMDGEFDNFAAGMNQVLLRNGSIPWGGDLKLGGNKITGLGNGTEASPAIQFLSDTTTGMYLQSAGNLGLVASGQERLRISASGVSALGRLITTDSVFIDRAAGLGRFLFYSESGGARFAAGTEATATPGGNVGSDYVINRFSDTSQFLGVPLRIARSNGNASFEATVFAPGIAATQSLTVGTSIRSNSDMSFSNLEFDIRVDPNHAYFQYATNTRNLQWFANGATNAVFSAAGGLTLRGSLSSASITAANSIAIDGPPGMNKLFFVTSNLSARWSWGQDSTAESGANAGGGWFLNRYDDGGNFMGSAMAVRRSDSFTSFPGQIFGPAFYIGTMNFDIDGNANFSNIVFDNRAGALNALLQYDVANKVLAYASNSATQFSVNSAGNMYVRNQVSAPFMAAGSLTVTGAPANSLTIRGGTDATYANLEFDIRADPNHAYFQYTGATHKLGWYSEGLEQLVLQSNRATVQNLTAKAAIAIGSGNFGIDGSTDASNIIFDGRSPTFSYLQYYLPSQTLTFVANNNVQLTINAAGDAVHRGAVTANNLITKTGLILADAASGAVRGHFALQVGEAAGNVGNDICIHLYDNAGAFLATPLRIKRNDQSFNIGAGSEIVSPVSSGAGFIAPYALKMIGTRPAIAFNENNLGTKAVIGSIAGGGIPKILFSRGNGTANAFDFDISTGVATCVQWVATSDLRLKSNIQPITLGLDAIAGLNAVTYLQATNQDDAQAGIGVFGAGVIAQDLIGTPFENLVIQPTIDGDGVETPYAMNYMGLTAFFIGALKEARTRLNTERTRLTNARNRINVLESQLADVLARLDAGGL
jgi:hypothetical protein